MTLKELLSGRELPVKVKDPEWGISEWFHVFYETAYFYHGHNNAFEPVRYVKQSVNWELYEEPKKKIKLKKFMLVDSKYKRVCYEYFENKNEVARFFVHNHFDRAIEIPNEEIEVHEDIFK
jgi:hypothetical protein